MTICYSAFTMRIMVYDKVIQLRLGTETGHFSEVAACEQWREMLSVSRFPRHGQSDTGHLE